MADLRAAAQAVVDAWARGEPETPESQRMRALQAALRQEESMVSFSSSVKVTQVAGEDFGAVAIVEPVQPSVGIDAVLAGSTAVQITEDAAEAFREGAELTLTFEVS
jgi:hypothetical protein